MARRGSFGRSLNPFGTGSSAGFAQYNIGDNVQDLARYKAEVAWGNGQLSDDAYLAVLQSVVASATPGSQAAVTAQNALDDAKYRIGRSRASAQGLDALIAFDQASLMGMSPDNVRYRSIKDSLNSELAQRRSDQYSKLVDQYNSGRIATAVLMTWVSNTLDTLSPDAPDYKQWQSTLASLRDRARSEKDAAAAQDYQMGRMTGDQWLAYLKSRRDQYDPTSPDYQQWNNRLEDETKSVQATKQARADQAFFDAYSEGKKSDKEYLAYIKARLDSMAADDPNREEWQHRYNTASYSLAEDALRFAVDHGKRPASDLMNFYKVYQRTLNPGSAEWRRTQDAIDSLAGYMRRQSAGGGSHSATGGGGMGPVAAGNTDKLISPKFTLEMAFTELALPVNASKEAQANFNLNYDSLQNAVQRGDKTWMFYDPAHPGQAVMLPVTSEALARLDTIRGEWNHNRAIAAFSNGDNASAYKFLDQSTNAFDAARLHNDQVAKRNVRNELNDVVQRIKLYTALGDDASVYDAIHGALTMLDDLINDPTVDDATRALYVAKAEQLASNPLNRAIDASRSTFDAQGNIVSVALMPGWHHVFDISSSTGEMVPKLVYDDGQSGAWDLNHVTVHINVGDRVVTADALLQDDKVGVPVLATIDGQQVYLPPGSVGVKTIVYFDGAGHKVQAYTVDGKTWVTSNSGAIPTLRLGVDLTSERNADGSVDFVDGQGNVIAKADAQGNMTQLATPPGSLTWVGQPAPGAPTSGGVSPDVVPPYAGYQYSSGSPAVAKAGEEAATSHFNFAIAGTDGSIVQFTTAWKAPINPLGKDAYQYSSGSPAVAAADFRFPAPLGSQAYQYSSGSPAVAKGDVRAALPVIPKDAYQYSSGSPAVAEADTRPSPWSLSPTAYQYSSGSSAVAAAAEEQALARLRLLAQLPPTTGSFSTGAGLAPVPPLPLKTYQYSSGSSAVAAAAKAAADAAAQAAAAKAAAHAGYQYSSGSSAVAAAAKPAAAKPAYPLGEHAGAAPETPAQGGGGPGPKAL